MNWNGKHNRFKNLGEQLMELIGHKKRRVSENRYTRSYSSGEESYSSFNAHLSQTLGVKPPKEEDIKRFGTSHGIIEVADDGIRTAFQKDLLKAVNARFDEAPKASHRRYKESYAEDLSRFGTSAGIINVASEDKEGRLKASPEHVKGKPEDIKRFGTRQGIVEVADDSHRAKLQNDQLQAIKARFIGVPEPANRRFKDTYQDDLKRFGTPEGIIEVANEEPKSQLQKSKRNKVRVINTAEELSKWLQCRAVSKAKERAITPLSLNPAGEAFQEFPKFQLTLSNTTSSDQEVVLWGDGSLSPGSSTGSVTPVTQISDPGAVHPQGMAYNPANQLTYSVNQMSGTVIIFNANNRIVKTVWLSQFLPGMNSPTAVAINTSTDSPHYGYAYVTGSVANVLSIIDLKLDLVAELATGVRPVSVVYNETNHFIYVSNLVSNTLTVYNGDTHLQVTGSPFPAGQGPMGMSVNPSNGNLYVANTLTNAVSVFDIATQPVTTIHAVGVYPMAVTYNPADQNMYAVANQSNEVVHINAAKNSISQSINVGLKPVASFFDPNSGLLMVQNSGSRNVTAINPQGEIQMTFSPGGGMGGLYNPVNGNIYLSDPTTSNINVIKVNPTANPVTVSENYAEVESEFKSTPAFIMHTKFIFSSQDRLSAFRIEHKTVTGKVKKIPVAFGNYDSPLNRLNVSEVTALKGTFLDRKTSWRFVLPANQRATVLIWYRPLNLHELLTENPNTNCP